MNKQVEEYLNEMQRYEKFEELKQKNQTLINEMCIRDSFCYICVYVGYIMVWP